MASATPKYLSAGLTNKWTLSLPDYPAPDWEVVYNLRCAGKTVINITSDADGSDHAIDISAATSAGYADGIYDYVAYATDGADKFEIERGTIEIKPDLSAATSSFDGRSQAQKIFDALEASILGLASADTISISINGKSIQRMSLDEKIKARDRYAAIVRSEKGTGHKIIRYRFT